MVLGGMKPVGKENHNFWTIFHYLNRQKFLPWLFFWLFLVSCGSGMNFEKSLELLLRFLTVKKVKNGPKMVKNTIFLKFKLFFSSKSVFLSNLSLFG